LYHQVRFIHTHAPQQHVSIYNKARQLETAFLGVEVDVSVAVDA
jgi:hypothetical protein